MFQTTSMNLSLISKKIITAKNSYVKHYILDTQIALWIITKNKKLDIKEFKSKFVRPGTSFIFHQASTWEIQIKYSLGKLPLPKRPKDFLIDAVKKSGFIYEHISDEGIFFLDKLPQIHKDPFDRLLISHAITSGWTVITSDESFQSYPVMVEAI